ncbi:MAG: hypothetical protein IPM34_04435 [Saprospiraceae bacterium]|nr:hypothetical protein [Saprospiraceae bacterium]
MEGFVLYADLLESRKLKDFFLISKKQEQMFSSLNEKFHSEFLFPPRTVKGVDEFELGLRSLNCLLDLFIEMNAILHPYIFRYHLSFGNIQMSEDFENKVLGGEVFHKINDNIEFMRKQDLLFLTSGIPSLQSGLLNSFFNAWMMLTSDWTVRQNEVMQMKRKAYAHKEIAEDLNISVAGAQKIAEQANWKQVLFIEKEFRNFLNEWKV